MINQKVKKNIVITISDNAYCHSSLEDEVNYGDNTGCVNKAFGEASLY